MKTPKLGSVLIVLHRVGPYHHARFQAAASALACPLVVLQTRPQSQEYPWSFVAQGAGYTLLSLEGSLRPEQDPPRSVLRHQLEQLLERYQPSVIVSVGWADRAYLQLMQLAQQRSVPLVVVSDSRRQDSVRSPWKEWLKRQLIRGYSAGIVAGSHSGSYLRELGMNADAIYQPWDVVDNDLIADLAAESASESLSKVERPFLCVGRFIPEKNHELLLKAFSSYQSNGGMRSLLLIGHGPLEHQIRLLCQQLPRPNAVRFAPFLQLEHLAHHYGQSHALLLASRKDTWALVVNEAMAAGLPVIVSSACGCTNDLVIHNKTGWIFNSDDADNLCELLHLSDLQEPENRQSMAASAKEQVAKFDVKSFALALNDSCQHAVSVQKKSIRGMMTSWVLSKFS